MDDPRTDEEIVDSVLIGDSDAYRVLIHRHSRWITSLVRRYLRDADAEDVAQEAFVTAYHRLHTFRREGKFRSWLSTIAVRKCYSTMLKQRRAPEIAAPPADAEYHEWLDTVAKNEMFQKFSEEENLLQARKTLQWAMDTLTPGDRMLVSLLYFEDRPVKEAAEILECSVTLVKVRAHRARKKLKTALQSLMIREEKT